MSTKLTLRFQSKSDKSLSRLKDAVRLHLWNNFKNEYKSLIPSFENFIDFYKLFETEWKDHPIYLANSIDEIVELLPEDITAEELLADRAAEYERRKKSEFRAIAAQGIEVASEEESKF